MSTGRSSERDRSIRKLPSWSFFAASVKGEELCGEKKEGEGERVKGREEEREGEREMPSSSPPESFACEFMALLKYLTRARACAS